jgi:glycosyltransferase involved in cell wall biosynthesis
VHAGKIAFFNNLAATTNLDFIVYFLSEPAKNRKWKKNDFSYNFTFKQLTGYKIYVPGNDHSYFHFNTDVISHLKKDKPTIVLSFGWNYLATWTAFLYCKSNGISFGLISESTAFEPSLQRVITRPLVSTLVKHSDYLFAISTRAKKYFLQLGAQKQKIKTIFSTSYQPAQVPLHSEIRQTKQQLGITNRDFVVLYVGQMIQRKGIDTLLKVAKELQNNKRIHFVLVGYGDLTSTILAQKKLHQLNNLHLVSYTDPKQIWRYYFSADNFILASYEETWGLVVNEAMEAGLPLLLSDRVGSSEDLLQHTKNGYRFSAGDSATVTSYINDLATNPKLVKQMGKMSKKIISKITPVSQAEALLDTLKKRV